MTYVAEAKMEQDKHPSLVSFTEEMTGKGVVLESEILECSEINATEKIAEKLKISGKSKIIKLVRKRLSKL